MGHEVVLEAEEGVGVHSGAPKEGTLESTVGMVKGERVPLWAMLSRPSSRVVDALLSASSSGWWCCSSLWFFSWPYRVFALSSSSFGGVEGCAVSGSFSPNRSIGEGSPLKRIDGLGNGEEHEKEREEGLQSSVSVVESAYGVVGSGKASFSSRRRSFSSSSSGGCGGTNSDDGSGGGGDVARSAGGGAMVVLLCVASSSLAVGDILQLHGSSPPLSFLLDTFPGNSITGFLCEDGFFFPPPSPLFGSREANNNTDGGSREEGEGGWG